MWLLKRRGILLKDYLIVILSKKLFLTNNEFVNLPRYQSRHLCLVDFDGRKDSCIFENFIQDAYKDHLYMDFQQFR